MWSKLTRRIQLPNDHLVANDRFSSVWLTYNSSVDDVISLRANTVDGYRVRITLDRLTDTTKADLAIMRGIHLTTGFLDVNGDPVLINIGAPGCDTLADLDLYGYYNPFAEQTAEYNERRRLFRGVISRFLDTQVDPATGRTDVMASTGLVPVPTKGTMVQSQRDWRMVAVGTDFDMRLTYAAATPAAPATFGLNARITGMLKWLEEHRIAGPAVDDRAVSLADVRAAVDARTYEIVQSGGRNHAVAD